MNSRIRRHDLGAALAALGTFIVSAAVAQAPGFVNPAPAGVNRAPGVGTITGPGGITGSGSIAPGMPAAGGITSPSPFPGGLRSPIQGTLPSPIPGNLPSPQPFPGGIPSTVITPPGAVDPGTPGVPVPPITPGPITSPGAGFGGIGPAPVIPIAPGVPGVRPAPAPPGPFTPVQIVGSFLGADADSDGELSRAEAQFLSLAPLSFEQMDRNGDGRVSRFEYHGRPRTALSAGV